MFFVVFGYRYLKPSKEIEKVRVIGSQEQMTGSREKNIAYCISLIWFNQPEKANTNGTIHFLNYCINQNVTLHIT